MPWSMLRGAGRWCRPLISVRTTFPFSTYTTAITTTLTPAHEESCDVIVIQGLVVPTAIGVLATEHGRTQRVRFDVEIAAVPQYRQQVQRTGNYLSYADTVAFIHDKAQRGDHVELVEDWAQAVADFALTHPLAAQVTVQVTKLDIFENAEGVGIRICRRRE